MGHGDNYIEINRNLWNERAKHHVHTPFYNQEAFLSGATSLQEIELELLGSVQGKSVLHLQCHFGQDTLSLARMGAKVTGIDLSPDAIAMAKDLAGQLQLDAHFVCSDIYELPAHLEGQFDMLFTTYGVIGWLPDMQQWAGIVSRFLKPGGTFLLVEFHPAVWMFDNGFTYIQYSYFNKETIIETEKGTYADKDADMEMQSVSWNHSLSEVMQSLLDEGLIINAFHEYDFSPYPFMEKAVRLDGDTERYVIKGMERKLPLVYAIRAVKP